MEIGICSYSFHRLLEAGQQDVFKYIADCKELGATQLDPWHKHLAPLADDAWKATADPADVSFSAEEEAYLDRVARAAREAGLPFGCIAVDGAHVFESTPEARRANRAFAYKWLDIAARLGAPQVRIDAGSTPELPDDDFRVIVDGYEDLVARGRDRGIEIIMENHWGATRVPENVVRILDAVDGLGLLFDTNNWAEGMQVKGWEMCARYATATHVKTFTFDDEGNEPSVDIPRAMHVLVEAGYDGCWGIESCPREIDEYEGVRRTIALMRRALGE